jgi:pimeloyl-ACP methyl ester carboxylesterase
MSTWIFLRGLSREARHWGNFPDVFRQAVANANIATPDLPGNGRLNHLASPLTIHRMVEHCRADLSRQGIAPPYHLLGLSLGAMVVVEWATRYPHDLLPCVLINTSMRPFSAFYQRLRPANYPDLLTLAMNKHDAGKKERAILKMTSTRGAEQTEVIDAWVSWRRQSPVTKLNTLRQLLAAARYRAPLKPPKTPLLVLVSANDRLVDPQCSHQMASHWGLATQTHATAGHDLPLDDGPWVARQVHNWTASLAS